MFKLLHRPWFRKKKKEPKPVENIIYSAGELPEVGSIKFCPKCGWDEFTPKFVEMQKRFIEGYKNLYWEEHVHCTCVKCGYGYNAKPLDYKPLEVPEDGPTP